MRESVKISATLCDPPRGRDTMETNMALLTKVNNSQYNRGQHIPNQREGTGQLKKGEETVWEPSISCP